LGAKGVKSLQVWVVSGTENRWRNKVVALSPLLPPRMDFSKQDKVKTGGVFAKNIPQPTTARKKTKKKTRKKSVDNVFGAVVKSPSRKKKSINENI